MYSYLEIGEAGWLVVLGLTALRDRISVYMDIELAPGERVIE